MLFLSSVNLFCPYDTSTERETETICLAGGVGVLKGSREKRKLQEYNSVSVCLSPLSHCLSVCVYLSLLSVSVSLYLSVSVFLSLSLSVSLLSVSL